MNEHMIPVQAICPPVEAMQLRMSSVRTVAKLLERASSFAGRAILAEQSGIAFSRLTEIVGIADLTRVRGIGPDHALALRAARIRSVRELRSRSAASVQRAVAKSGGLKLTPPLSFVERWVEEAKLLDIRITHNGSRKQMPSHPGKELSHGSH